MKRIYKALGSIFGLLITIGVMFLWVRGLKHSYSKHDKFDFVVSFFPPWGIFRGVESFWHHDKNKFADVDWKKRLGSDLRTTIYFITEGSYKDANVYEINENIEQFSDKIKEYPKEKLQYLRDGSRKYIEYTLSATKDGIGSVIAYYDKGIYDTSFSETTHNLKQILLSNYELSDIISPLEIKLAEVAAKMNETKLSEISAKDLKEMKEKFNTQVNTFLLKNEADMKRIFKNIFNEEY
jgi:hypothetical protein